jgi:hypothetical protein
MAFQFIVISVSDERKRLLEKQFVDLNIKVPLQFLESPSLVSNSQDYLPKDITDEINLKVICCARNHLRAIEAACKEDAPHFTVICEDDIAVHKTQFINGIEEIIANWDTVIAPDKMASIGWIPCMNYSSYISVDSKYTLKCVLGSKILHDRFVPGAQAYIVRKKDLIPLLKHLIHPTFDQFKAHILSMKFPNIPNESYLNAIDMFINCILGQAVVFPPLIVEQDTPSLLGHDNINKFWYNFFKDYESIKKNYYSL